MYALRTVSHFPFPRENPRTPRVIEHMEIWGDLEMAEIESKYADDYVILETKQQILDALLNVDPNTKN